MTYYGPKQLSEAFRTVRKNTIQIGEEIPEAHYGFRATPETRSVAETLVHLAVTTRFPQQVHIVERRSTMEGIDFASLFAKMSADEKAPRSKSEILELLRTEGENFAAALEAVPDEALADQVHFPQGMVPPTKTRFEMLLGPKEHEMHHRAQLMVMERMLGITPHLTRQMQERMAAMKTAKAGA